MNRSVAVPRREKDVQFTPLSSTEWRVSDRRYPEQSIEALLGFVARHGDSFYATSMDHPAEAIPMSSLDTVARFFSGK